MVVIFIIGLMAGVAMPAFLNFLKAFRLRTAGRQVVGDLNVARQRAITKNRDYFVFFPTTTSYDIIESNLQRGIVLAGTNSFRYRGPVEIGSHLVLVSSGTKPAGASGTAVFFPNESLSPLKDTDETRTLPSYSNVPAVVFRPDGSVKNTGAIWVRLEEFVSAGSNFGGPRFAWVEVNTNSVGKIGSVAGP
jgi:type II secretory pathway pseudopilin PulG